MNGFIAFVYILNTNCSNALWVFCPPEVYSDIDSLDSSSDDLINLNQADKVMDGGQRDSTEGSCRGRVDEGETQHKI